MTEETLEDSGDKIRRNLVMVSTAVLAGAFLGVKLDGSAKLLGFIEIPYPSTWKIWLLLSLGLIYLLLRYKFDDLTKDLSQKSEKVFREQAMEMICAFVNKGVKSKVLRGMPCEWINTEELEAKIVHEAKSYERTSSKRFGENPKPEALECTGDFSNDLWDGRVSFGFNVSPLQAGGWDSSARVTYRLPFYFRIWVAISVSTNIIWNTKIGIDLILPYIFGWLAMLACAWKIAEPYAPWVGWVLMRGIASSIRWIMFRAF